MHPFLETISVAGAIAIAIVGAIVIVTLFVKTLSWLSREGAKPETMAVRGVIGKNIFVAVHMVGGHSFDRVQLIGFTSSQSIKAHLPYELNGMVILEDEGRQRYLVRARDIKMIVVPTDESSVANPARPQSGSPLGGSGSKEVVD